MLPEGGDQRRNGDRRSAEPLESPVDDAPPVRTLARHRRQGGAQTGAVDGAGRRPRHRVPGALEVVGLEIERVIEVEEHGGDHCGGSRSTKSGSAMCRSGRTTGSRSRATTRPAVAPSP